MQLFILAATIAEELSQLRLLSPICFSEKPPDFSSNRIIGKSSLPGEPRSFLTTRKCLQGVPPPHVFSECPLFGGNYSSSILIFGRQLKAAPSTYLVNSAEPSVFTGRGALTLLQRPECQGVPGERLHNYVFITNFDHQPLCRPHYLSDSLSIWYMRKLIGSWNTNLECMQFSGDYIKGL